eukprot:Cvel_29483.t1-p1 / transcript=Cvel_29483.t1 / gene=Cvel_29483 / organism=Chromera_velia_CCMP2878 / gene_product=hypothetical protein / transcript_product=hypothetical protein / location=Cvel_scaffold4045:7602-11395(+) / protein_length=194 / sequence_SO=supercontig / SO=protein_coding / is_pseudo=false
MGRASTQYAQSPPQLSELVTNLRQALIVKPPDGISQMHEGMSAGSITFRRVLTTSGSHRKLFFVLSGKAWWVIFFSFLLVAGFFFSVTVEGIEIVHPNIIVIRFSRRGANLPQTLTDLSSVRAELETMKKTSLESRKKLAEETKTLKKADEQTKLENMEALIKNYQHEIDGLLKRAKFSESSLSKLAQMLSTLP